MAILIRVKGVEAELAGGGWEDRPPAGVSTHASGWRLCMLWMPFVAMLFAGIDKHTRFMIRIVQSIS